MNVEVKVTKGRDGWEAISMIHIPGRPEQVTGGDTTPTHVRVSTGKASRGGLFTYASEVGKTAMGFNSLIDFHDPAPWERLGASPDRCTEKSVRLLHEISLAALLNLRPELRGYPGLTIDVQVQDEAKGITKPEGMTHVQWHEAMPPSCFTDAADKAEKLEQAKVWDLAQRIINTQSHPHIIAQFGLDANVGESILFKLASALMVQPMQLAEWRSYFAQLDAFANGSVAAQIDAVINEGRSSMLGASPAQAENSFDEQAARFSPVLGGGVHTMR